jgi:hypothetical protein
VDIDLFRCSRILDRAATVLIKTVVHLRMEVSWVHLAWSLVFINSIEVDGAVYIYYNVLFLLVHAHAP